MGCTSSSLQEPHRRAWKRLRRRSAPALALASPGLAQKRKLHFSARGTRRDARRDSQAVRDDVLRACALAKALLHAQDGGEKLELNYCDTDLLRAVLNAPNMDPEHASRRIRGVCMLETELNLDELDIAEALEVFEIAFPGVIGVSGVDVKGRPIVFLRPRGDVVKRMFSKDYERVTNKVLLALTRALTVTQKEFEAGVVVSASNISFSDWKLASVHLEGAPLKVKEVVIQDTGVLLKSVLKTMSFVFSRKFKDRLYFVNSREELMVHFPFGQIPEQQGGVGNIASTKWRSTILKMVKRREIYDKSFRLTFPETLEIQKQRQIIPREVRKSNDDLVLEEMRAAMARMGKLDAESIDEDVKGAVRRLKDLFKHHGVKVRSDLEALRMIAVTSGDLRESFFRIQKLRQVEREHGLDNISEMEAFDRFNEALPNTMCVTGVDSFGRSILVANPPPNATRIAIAKDLLPYTYKYFFGILRNATVTVDEFMAGMVFVFFAKNFSLQMITLSNDKRLSPILHKGVPIKIKEMWFRQSGAVFRTVWRAFSPFLARTVRNRCNFSSADFERQFDPEQFPVGTDFGTLRYEKLRQLYELMVVRRESYEKAFVLS